MSFKIVCDSCTDPIPALMERPECVTVPLIIRIGNEEFVDNGTLSTEELIRRMADCPDGTGSACPSPQWYMDAFEGADDVYVITLSAELSGSYNSAIQARDIYLDEHPDAHVHVFNSHSASAGQSALLTKLYELCSEGRSFEEVIAEADHFIAHLTTLFVLENLDNLRKNGRLTNLQAIITGTLRIKLVMEGTPAGTINKLGQALSMKQALSKLAEQAVAKAEKHGIQGRTLVISHCNCPDRALYVRNLILKKLPFDKVEILHSSGLSTVYTGDGGVVVAF